MRRFGLISVAVLVSLAALVWTSSAFAHDKDAFRAVDACPASDSEEAKCIEVEVKDGDGLGKVVGYYGIPKCWGPSCKMFNLKQNGYIYTRNYIITDPWNLLFPGDKITLPLVRVADVEKAKVAKLEKELAEERAKSAELEDRLGKLKIFVYVLLAIAVFLAAYVFQLRRGRRG